LLCALHSANPTLHSANPTLHSVTALMTSHSWCRRYAAACLAEAKWSAARLATAKGTYVLVPTMPLETANTAELLASLAAIDGVRGIRQIVNHQPDWPRNKKLGDLLDSPAWQAGFAELSKVGFSFDLQLNPPQYLKAAAVIAANPTTTVIINHLGCAVLVFEQNFALEGCYRDSRCCVTSSA
jgi:predicted TIM-barrel fold metal-dependent hydrolase